jgi:hypothetical protein
MAPIPPARPHCWKCWTATGRRPGFFLHRKQGGRATPASCAKSRSADTASRTTATAIPALSRLTAPGGLQSEIESAQETLAAISGRGAGLLSRAHGCCAHPLLDPVLDRLGLTYVSWTRRGLDTVNAKPETVLSRLAAKLAGGRRAAAARWQRFPQASGNRRCGIRPAGATGAHSYVGPETGYAPTGVP